jgi:hypothetical protein
MSGNHFLLFWVQSKSKPYLDLDQDTLEQSFPPQPRYDAVQYAQINGVQPIGRPEQ